MPQNYSSQRISTQRNCSDELTAAAPLQSVPTTISPLDHDGKPLSWLATTSGPGLYRREANRCQSALDFTVRTPRERRPSLLLPSPWSPQKRRPSLLLPPPWSPRKRRPGVRGDRMGNQIGKRRWHHSLPATDGESYREVPLGNQIEKEFASLGFLQLQSERCSNDMRSYAYALPPLNPLAIQLKFIHGTSRYPCFQSVRSAPTDGPDFVPRGTVPTC